jgi:hypothetical protein
LTSPEAIKIAFEQGLNIYGLYYNRHPPYIVLNISDIYRGVPMVYWLTPVPTLLIAYSLAHEVAHHIVATRGRGCVIKAGESLKPNEQEEVFADKYAFSVLERMSKRWYYRLGKWAIRDLSDWHYISGISAWRSKDYVSAAEHWHNAWALHANNNEAAYWYKRAKEMLKDSQNSL